MKYKLTMRSARKVFDAILATEKEDQKVILAAFDKALDELASNDFFGTEAQCDPRGDQRDDD